MFTLGFNEFIRNIRKNIWVIFELILLFMIGIFMVSTVSEQMRTYRAVSDVLDESGIILFDPGMPVDCFDELKGVEKIVKVPVFGYSSGMMDVDIVSDYPEYKIKLTSGKYCTTGKQKDGVVRAMVCDSTGLEAGDTLEVKLPGTEIYIKLYVTGTFDADEWVFGLWRGESADYKSLFDTYNNRINNRNNYYLFVVNAEDMQKKMKDISYYSFAIINYNDDITEEELEFNKSLLEEHNCSEGRCYKAAKEIYFNTKSLIEIKLVPIGIAFIIVFIFSIFSIIAASSVSFKYERRNYGIYFLTGNTWKNTILLTIVHWGIAIVSSLFIAVCGSIILGKTAIMSDFNLEFSVVQICVISGIIVIQLLMALLIPWRMLRKTEPVTIIKESER